MFLSNDIAVKTAEMMTPAGAGVGSTPMMSACSCGFVRHPEPGLV
jgi:hypothetical protein